MSTWRGAPGWEGGGAGGGGIGGGGAAGRVTLWNGPVTLTSHAGFLWIDLGAGLTAVSVAGRFSLPSYTLGSESYRVDANGVHLANGQLFDFWPGAACNNANPDVGLISPSVGVMRTSGRNFGTDYGSQEAANETVICVATPAAPVISATEFAKATITTILAGGGGIVDGDWFRLNDSVGDFDFEFDDDSVVTPGRTPIDITGGKTADEVRDLIVTAIGISGALMTASGTVAAQVDAVLQTPNVPTVNVDNVAAVGFSLTNFVIGGASLWGYKVIGKTADGSVTLASAEGQTFFGPPALSGGPDYNTITYVVPTGAFSVDIVIVRKPGGAVVPPELIATGETSGTYDDLAGTGAPYTLPLANTTGEQRFQNAAGAQVGFKAPAAIVTPTIWELPDADGATNAFFRTNGLAQTSWTALSCLYDTADITFADTPYVPVYSGVLPAGRPLYIEADCTGGNIVVTPAAAVNGQVIILVKSDATANTLTFTPNGAEAGAVVLNAQWQFVQLLGRVGVGWRTIG